MSNIDPQTLEQLQKMIDNSTKKPMKGAAKFLTLTMLVIVFVVGIVGSFAWANFDMEKFTMFLPVFGIMYVPLILSIGAASVVKKVKEKEEVAGK